MVSYKALNTILKGRLPMLVTPSGIFTEVKLLQSAKRPLPIGIQLGSTIFLKLDNNLNTQTPIVGIAFVELEGALSSVL